MEIGKLDARRQLLSQQVISKSISKMTRLERSLAKRKSKRSEYIETRRVGGFLTIMTQTLEEYINGSVFESSKTIEV